MIIFKDGTRIDKELEIKILHHFDFKSCLTLPMVKEYFRVMQKRKREFFSYYQFIMNFAKKYEYSVASFIRDVVLLERCYSVYFKGKYFHLIPFAEQVYLRNQIIADLCAWKGTTQEEVFTKNIFHNGYFRMFERSEEGDIHTISFADLVKEVRLLDDNWQRMHWVSVDQLLKYYGEGSYQ